jgi:hypothetical protein
LNHPTLYLSDLSRVVFEIEDTVFESGLAQKISQSVPLCRANQRYLRFLAGKDSLDFPLGLKLRAFT